MSTDKLVDSWFRFLSPTVQFPHTIRYPAGGDFGGFTYQPYTKWEAPALMRGDDEVEQRVYREVASPGRQLGKLTEVVLELSTEISAMSQKSQDSTKTKELREISARILDIKKSVEDTAENQARDGLDRLGEKSKTRLKKFIEEYSNNLDR